MGLKLNVFSPILHQQLESEASEILIPKALLTQRKKAILPGRGEPGRQNAIESSIACIRPGCVSDQ